MPHGTESSTLISSCITVSFHILGGSQINSISRRRFSEECISPASTTTSMAHTVPKSEYSRFLSRHLDNPTSNTSLTKRANLTTRRPRRQELPEDKKKQLKDAFDLFDTEKQGSIDYHELKILMRALGFTVSKQRVLDLVNEVDVHRNGRVTFSDYMEISMWIVCSTGRIIYYLVVRREVLARDPDEEITKVDSIQL